jgi:hypothetical protein
VHGRGLLLGGGNAIGTSGGQSVFTNLFCGPASGGTASSSNMAGVALDADGDFVIDDILSPMLLTPCQTAALLIRTTRGAVILGAAGIPR